MSKYNLTDLYEGMSDKEYSDAQEKERLEAHPEKDKIKAVQAMMAKEKVKEEGMYIDDEEWEAEMGRTPEDTEKEIKKEMDKLKEDHQSLDPEVASRIEGLLDQPLKKKFLEAGMALIQDVTDEDPFQIDDIVSHLANELNAYYDGFEKEGDRLAGLEEEAEEVEEADKLKPGYHADGTPKSNDEMDDDEREEFYSNLDSVDEDQALKEHFGRFLKDYQ